MSAHQSYLYLVDFIKKGEEIGLCETLATLSEIALALKCSKPVILLNYEEEKRFEPFQHAGILFYAGSPREVIAHIQKFISEKT